MTRIERLSITGFRGITQSLELVFDPKKKVYLIFGENGTGKTSIIDAIDYITNKNLGSIKDKGAGVAANMPSLNGNGKASINLTSGERTWLASFDKGKAILKPAELMGTRILRRASVQKFTEASASEKFAEIKHLLEIETVEQAENSVREAGKAINDRIAGQERIIETNKRTIGEAWEKAGQPHPGAQAWAESLGDARSSATASSDDDALRLLIGLRDQLAALAKAESDLVAAQSELDAREHHIATHEGLNAEETIKLSKLLETAAAMMGSAPQGEACPLCEQPVAWEALRSGIDSRRVALQQFSALDTERQAWKGKRDANAARIEHHKASISSLVEGISRDDSLPLPESTEPAAMHPWVETTIARLEGERQQSAQVHGRVQQALGTLQAAQSEQERLKGVLSLLTSMEQTMRAERHAFSEQMLSTVKEECNRMFGVIHPGEGLGLSELSLDPKARSSLVQKATFAGQMDIVPQAIYSEGHLDTLGFAFWLAHSKLESQRVDGGAVVLVDDVLSSVDAGHLDRIVELVVQESDHFAQIIFTTHSRQVRDAFSGSHGNAEIIELVELNSFWKPEWGTRINNSKSHTAALREAMSGPNWDRQRVASNAGIVLERTLLILAETFRLYLPYSPRNEQNLQNLLEVAASKLKKLECEHPSHRPQRTFIEIVDELKVTGFVRNQVGAHFNVSGHSVTDIEVEMYGRNTLELVDFLTCKTCGQIPRRVSGDRLGCICKSDQTYLRPARV